MCPVIFIFSELGEKALKRILAGGAARVLDIEIYLTIFATLLVYHTLLR